MANASAQSRVRGGTAVTCGAAAALLKIYTDDYVYKLRDAVARSLTLPHIFVYLTHRNLDAVLQPQYQDWHGDALRDYCNDLGRLSRPPRRHEKARADRHSRTRAWRF
jgi:hypothetical protein